MGDIFELTYSDLRCKEIVNAVDGKKLGRILDMVFNRSGQIRGIVAPFGRKGLFLRAQEIFIPFRCIKKIGEDIILVELLDTLPHGGKKAFKEKQYCMDERRDDRSECHNEQDYRNYYKNAEHCDGAAHSKQRDCSDHHHKEEHCDYRVHHDHDRDDHPKVHHDHHDHHHDRQDHCDHDHEKGRESCGGNRKDIDCDRRCEKCMLFDCIHRWKEGEGIFVDRKKYEK